MNKIKQEINKIEIPNNLKSKRDLGIQLAKSEMPGKKKKLYPLVAILTPVFLLFLGLIYFINDAPPPKNPTIKTIEMDYIIDILNPEAVVDFADNVFIGTVEVQVDTIQNDYPETQFEVKVLENIKGNLDESEVINQLGGYEGNDLLLIEGDELLETNKTYLFATIDSEENNKRTIIPIGGSISVENEKHMSEIKEKYTKLYNKDN
ncbi:hypothetical protein [Oceanobacillus kapialis]|uniref:hypothetical protein n=1 Tax=Oceanobacillus kapialis TaxID=481353 RepID=UPI00384DCD85